MATLDKKPRLKLPVRGRAYFAEIRKGLALGYRRNQGPGTWIVRGADGKGKNWMKKIAVADDSETADGDKVMTHDQARERAITLARGNVASSSDHRSPITVEGAIKNYETDLLARGQSRQNATSVRFHLKDTALFKLPVALLEKSQLAGIRNGMVASGMKPSSADRVGKSFKAAMNLAASHDPRITNFKAWSDGWKLLPNTTVARNIILSDGVVGAIVRAAYGVDHQLGIQLDIMAETGVRESQMLRLHVSDLQDDRTDPRLMMPSSRKGRNRQPRHIPVPISARLAVILRAAVVDRAGHEPIVHEITRLSDRFREVADIVGDIPEKVVPYSFRHSSIVRMLRGNVPIRIVAAIHDTSVVTIEKHYSAFITDDDTLARATLPDFGIAMAA
jgi:Phage integrase family